MPKRAMISTFGFVQGLLPLTSLVLSLLMGGFAFAQEGTNVINVDFDDLKPRYTFAMSFGGYALRGSDELIRFKDSLGTMTEMTSKGGAKGGAIEITLDTRKAKIPDDDKLEYGYMGLGVGINGDVIEGDLSDFELANYKVAFDAKIENGKTMKRSRFGLIFVCLDDQGPEKDEDTNDDELCVLGYGGEDSDDRFELTNEFQSFEVETADMLIERGSIEQIKKFKTRGATLLVVAEDDPEKFGVDGSTKLIIDNYRLIKK